MDTVSEFHAEAPQATVSEGLPKVPRWRLERDSNLRPFGRNHREIVGVESTNGPQRDNAPHSTLASDYI